MGTILHLQTPAAAVTHVDALRGIRDYLTPRLDEIRMK
jgi:hypothetical protein